MTAQSNRTQVIGLGYIGLPTALLLADTGLEVIGVDVDQNKINALKANKLYFNEPGLEKLYTKAQDKKFSAGSTVQPSDTFVIAVPTPQNAGTADLTYVISALRSIEPVFQPGNLIVIESTVGPRDCVDHILPLIKKWNKPFLFSHCPERAIPGNTLHEMVHNDRIIGGIDEESRQVTKALYASFVKGNIYLTDPTTAAACKVMENTYRSVNIALANEFAKLAERLDFNCWEAIELANKHPRVQIHSPGPGVGGHCIPIDPWFFVREQRSEESLIRHALEINTKMANHVVEAVSEAIKLLAISNPTIGILGVAYKKNVDDARETPAARIAELFSEKFQVLMTDEHVKQDDLKSLEQVLSTCSVIVLVTDHDQYAEINFSEYPNIKLVYDTRNCISANAFDNSSAVHLTIGKKSS